MLARLNEIAHDYLELIQHVIGSPLWVLGNVCFFVLWMIAMLVLQLIGWHPLDSPLAFFPATVWMMTVVGYFIELAMKAQTNMMQKIQGDQDERLREQVDRIESVLKEVRRITSDSEKRDEVTREMIMTIQSTANLVLAWLTANDEDGES